MKTTLLLQALGTRLRVLLRMVDGSRRHKKPGSEHQSLLEAAILTPLRFG